jgi:hypothetical protein
MIPMLSRGFPLLVGAGLQFTLRNEKHRAIKGTARRGSALILWQNRGLRE